MITSILLFSLFYDVCCSYLAVWPVRLPAWCCISPLTSVMICMDLFVCVSIQDYSWEDHGFSLMNRLYGEMAQLLDEKFQVVYALTYHTMAMHTQVDTSTLRKALWNYIHCIYGIR